MKEIATIQINRRAKPGEGKEPFGISPRKLKMLTAIRADTSQGLKAHSENLYSFTEIHIGRARELAQAGKKDEARDWFRFFTNANIVPLLVDLPCAGDVSKLADELKLLGTECHPLDVPSFATDLQAIRACMAEILSYVKNDSQKTESFRRSNHRRAEHRDDGYRQPEPEKFERAYDTQVLALCEPRSPARLIIRAGS